MSWDPRSGARSSAAEPPADWQSQIGLADDIRGAGATLLDALETHVPGSRDHADATASYGFAAAVELGLEREHAEAIREAARLHEVGMIYVPAAILGSPPEGRQPRDRELVEAHPAYGAELARGAGVPAAACDWIRATAERFDGRGPARLAGERVPLQARIIRVACAFDSALTAPRADGSAAEHRAAAFVSLRTTAGRELDPRVVEALTAMLARVTRP
jgi:HD-GYP domain-containing protein (c-di-GMP phosphodiesterase class II)